MTMNRTSDFDAMKAHRDLVDAQIARNKPRRSIEINVASYDYPYPVGTGGFLQKAINKSIRNLKKDMRHDD